MPLPFSVVILTLNEERDLPRCLESVAGCADVVVLDSGSTDRTGQIAEAAGARVFTRPFDTFAGQRNYAQSQIPFRNPWVFHLDADEAMTPDLAAECSAAVSREDLDGYWAAPRMMFQGRWVPHCTDYPAWQARFVRAPQFQFIDVGHGQREASSMRMARLKAGYLHDLSSGGESEWLDKHRRYARQEAEAHLAALLSGREPGAGASLAAILSSDSLRRRRELKRLSYRLPCRGTLRFLYQYLARLGFLDGAPGLRYCKLLAQYESFVAEELRRLKAP